MPKRAKQAEDEMAQEEGVPEVSEDEDKPTPPKGSKKRKPKAAKEQSQDDDDKDKPKKRKAQKVQEPTEPYDIGDGWTAYPPSVIYKIGATAEGTKIAALDFDGTLITSLAKSFAQQHRNPKLWALFNKQVPAKLKEFVEGGYQLVIISNQGQVKSKLNGAASTSVRARIDEVCTQVGIQPWVFLATQEDDNRKPKPGMFTLFKDLWEKKTGRTVDIPSSFYVGDAAGRPDDFADSDKKFAEAVGLKFMVPEDVFGQGSGKKELPRKTGSDGPNHNPQLTEVFQRLYKYYLPLGGTNIYKARTFQKISDIVAAFPKPIAAANELKNVKGVGKGSIGKIQEFLDTGTVSEFESGEQEPQPKAAQATAAAAFM